MFKRIYTILSALVLVISALPVYADDDDVLFNEVQLQAKAEREVPNDEMRVVMVAEHEGKHPPDVAEKVNQDMDWALSIVRDVKNITSKTRTYHTNPVYRDRSIIAWHTSQELELKSKSMTELTELVGELQGRLQVRQMLFVPTEETRTRHENELIEEAMEAFKRRVEIISKHMDNMDYRVVKLIVNTGDYYPQPVRMERARMATMAADMSAPAVDAGTSNIVVTVNGSVQFF